MVTFDELFTGGYQYRVSADGQSGGNVICDCNSAGGVSVFGALRNTGTKTIKYVILTSVTPMNQVGDPVWCSIGNGSEIQLTFTGPLGPGQKSGRIQWENMWYNPTIHHLKVGDVKVIYMDGTEETIPFQVTAADILEEERKKAELPEKLRTAAGVALIFFIFIVLVALLN